MSILTAIWLNSKCKYEQLWLVRSNLTLYYKLLLTASIIYYTMVHGKTTYEWYMDDIPVTYHLYGFIRVTYEWHMSDSLYDWHKDDTRVEYEWHASDIRNVKLYKGSGAFIFCFLALFVGKTLL